MYVTSPTGDEFGMFPMPEDKEALIATRQIIKRAHRLRIVYNQEKADLIVVVSGRPPKDVITIFDNHASRRCLWHLSQKHGLRGSSAPLAKAFEAELEKAQAEMGASARTGQ